MVDSLPAADNLYKKFGANLDPNSLTLEDVLKKINFNRRRKQ